MPNESRTIPEPPQVKDVFNEKTFDGEQYGIRVYVTELVPPGTVIKGHTVENIMLQKGAKIDGKVLDVSKLSKVTHLAVHPKSKESLIKNLKDSIVKERNKLLS